MAVIWVVVLLVPWVLITLVVVALVRTGRRGGDMVVVPAALALEAASMRSRANQRVLLAGAGGAGGAVVLVLALTAEWGFQAVALAAVAAAGAASLAIALIGPPTAAPAAIRSAELAPRTSRGFGPSWAFVIPAGLAAALVLLVAASGLSSSSVGGGQRAALAWTSADGASGYVRPYPGWDTGLPVLAVLALSAAAFLFALHRVAAWPRPIDPDLFGLDDEIRRASTRMLLFGASGALIAALGSIANVVAGAWETVAMDGRLNRGTTVPILDSAHETLSATGSSTLERALDVAVPVATTCVFIGITFMLAALAAGWVRIPQLVADPVAHL